MDTGNYLKIVTHLFEVKGAFLEVRIARIETSDLKRLLRFVSECPGVYPPLAIQCIKINAMDVDRIVLDRRITSDMDTGSAVKSVGVHAQRI